MDKDSDEAHRKRANIAVGLVARQPDPMTESHVDYVDGKVI